MSKEFTCAVCGGEFTKTWDDTEATADEEFDHPDEIHYIDKNDLAIVCDDCNRKGPGNAEHDDAWRR